MDSMLMGLCRFNRRAPSRVLVGLLAFFLMFSVVLPMNGTQAETAEGVVTESMAAEYASARDDDTVIAEGVVEGLGKDPAAVEEETGGEAVAEVPEDEYGTDSPVLAAADLGEVGIVALSYIDIDGVTYTSDKKVLVSYPIGNTRPLYEVIPEAEEIATNAFNGAQHLITIVLPDSLRTINNGAFANCTNLTTINLPEGLRTIGANAFGGCIYLPAITFPASLTSIAHGAHNTGAFIGCTRLVSVTFNNSKASIGNYTFSGVTSLRELDLGNGITAIGSYAFNGCTGLREVNINSDTVTIDQYAFNGCTALTDLVIENAMTTIRDFAFYGCTKLENVDFGDNLISISNAAFMNCSSLTELTFPASLTSIAGGNSWSWAFYGCSNLAKVTFLDSEATIGDRAFQGCTKLTEVNFGSKLKSIGHYAFHNTGLTDVQIPASVTTIGEGSFSGSARLKTVWIGEEVRSIGADAFVSCPLLESITVDENNIDFIDIDGVLFRDDYILNTAVLIKYPPNKEGVTYTVPGNVIEIANNAFHGAQKLTAVSLPEGLKTIGAGAFANCNRLTSITFPASLTSIANGGSTSGAFYGCTNLSKVTFNGSAASIGNYTFSGLTNLREVDFGSKVTVIGAYAFSGCTGLNSLTIPKDLYHIGSYAFNGCTGLKTINIKSDVVTIDQYAFNGCTALASLVIENSETIIRDFAFHNCNKLEYVDFGENLKSISNGAFMYCSSLKELTFPASLTSIAGGNSWSWAFYGCSNLTKVTFANSATVIGDRAFQGLTKLTEVNFGSKLVSIGTYSFYGTGLKEVLIPASTLSIGSQAFAYCPELVIAYICSTNTSRGLDAFLGCGKLEYIICPYPTDGKVLITVVPEHGGSATGTGAYSVGDRVNILATPNNEYSMEGWYLNGQKVGSDRLYSFTVTNTTENSTYVARFKYIGEHYTITATPDPTNGGIIMGTGNYVSGSLVNLRAIANPNFEFDGWFEGGDKIEGAGAEYSFNATADRVLTAKFKAEAEYTITLYVDPEKGGTVTGGGKYARNTTVTVTAVTNTGYEFIGWYEDNGAVSALAIYTDPIYSFVVTRDRTLTARFITIDIPVYTISVNHDPIEGGSVTGNGLYAQSATATVVAVASSGYQFVGWYEDDGLIPGAEANYSFIVTRDRDLTAKFTLVEEEYTITVNANPSAGGTVTGSGKYAAGTTATVSAVANTEYRFDGWYEGDQKVAGADAAYSFTVTKNRTLTARFVTDIVGEAVVRANNVRGIAGKTVTVMIDIENNPGLAGMQLEIEYDKSVMELKGIDKVVRGSALAGLTFAGVNPITVNSNPFKVAWAGRVNDNSNGNILKVELAILDTAKEGVYPIKLTYSQVNTVDENNKPVALKTIDGSVTILSFLYGDVNMDGAVTLYDAVMVMQYVAGWTIEPGTFSVEAADVDGDGEITAFDAVLIMQYVNGWFDKFPVER